MRGLQMSRLQMLRSGSWAQSANSWKSMLLAIFATVALMLVTLQSQAQTISGSLAGSITDPTGAVVPNAKISVVGASSGITYNAVSSSAGVYRINGILPGVYDVTVRASGFQKSVHTGVSIAVSVVAALDIRLNVGSAQETVTVSAEAPTLQTQSSDISTTISTRQVEELPLSLGGVGALRSAEAFVFLTPGTQGVGTTQGNPPVFAQRISGGQAMGQEVLLDGASVDRSEWHSEFDEVAPSVDALQEFTIESSTIPAEYSRTAGGVVTFVTKSGTNDFHGVLYDIFKNDALDGNTWFNNGYIAQNGNTEAARRQFRRPIDKKNDYGATIGGPIRIPWLYNGRNRSFFFFSYEQFRQSSSGTTVSTIPTEAEQAGNFQQLLGPVLKDGNGAPLINPCDGSQIYKGQIFDPATQTTVGGVPCRTAFPNNTIDPGRFSNVAKATITLLPKPMNGNLTQNFAYSDSFPLTNTTWTVRGDQVLTQEQKLSLSLSHRLNSSQVGLVSLPYPLDPGHQKLTFKTIFARANYQYTLSPNLLNSLILGYNRYDSASKMPTASGGNDWSSKLGIGNTQPNDHDFPQFTFVDPQGITTLGSNVNNESIDNGYRINDNVTWNKGRHSLNIGANLAYQEFAPNNFAGSQGLFSFGQGETAPSANFGPNAGSAWASFVLGQVNNASLTDRGSQSQWRSNYYAFYGQDTYKLLPSLVVNYGLNWSIETPRRELHNRTSAWDPSLPNPGADGTLGALQFATSNNRSFIGTYLKDFSPRLGFSWAPSFLHNHTVFRGGYGIYYASLFYGDTGNRLTDGFTTTPSPVSLNGFDAAFKLDDGFPAYIHAPFIDPSLDNGNGVSGYIEPGYNRPAYVQNWSLQVQQELAPDLIFSLAYVGTKGNRLRSEMREVNALQEKGLALGTVLSESINSPDAAQAQITAPFPSFQSIWGQNVNVGQALRSWPQVGNINTGDVLENLGQSSYNSLQARLERRFRNGLNLLVSYTWAKTLTDSDSLLPYFAQVNGGGSVQDPYDRKAEKSVSNEDTPNVFVVSYIYELPVGRNKHFLSSAPPVISQAISGWQISGIQRYQSGQPIAVCCTVGVPDLDSGMRPDFTGLPVEYSGGQGHGFNPFDPAHDRWLHGLSTTPGETAPAFADPNANRGPFIPWRFGNVPRVYGGARSTPYAEEDFSLQKNTHITEGTYVEFRAEFFNAFNRHVFRQGDLGIESNTFGKVFGTFDAPRKIQLTLKFHY